MKNFIYSIVLIASTSIYAQNNIESDQLFLKYEQEYVKNLQSTAGFDYEQAYASFSQHFTDIKAREKFFNSDDKLTWLTKNFKKTAFTSASEAVASYNNLLQIKATKDAASSNLIQMRSDLLKKYDGMLIYQTLKTRAQAK